MMPHRLLDARVHLAEMGVLLFDRHLLDLAGGNMSLRVDDLICISPRYSGPTNHWHLTPEQIMVVDGEGKIIEGTGQLSRESKVHLRLHSEFRDYGTAVIHAHAKNTLVFAALGRPIPPVLEATRKFGEIPVIDYAPAHSEDLSTFVAGALRGNEARIKGHAAGVIAPYHGLFVMGKDLNATADAVERIDTNAYCLIMGAMLGGSPMLEKERAAMESAITGFNKG